MEISHYAEDCYIFGDTRDAVNKDLDFTVQSFEDIGWRISHKKTKRAAAIIDLMGLRYNMAATTASAKTGYLHDLALVHMALAKRNTTVTKKQLASLVGSLTFPNEAYPGSISLLNPLNALIKAKEGWTHTYAYNTVAPYMTRALAAFLHMPPCPLQVFTQTPTSYYTDATTTQIGIVGPGIYMAKQVTEKIVYRTETQGIHWLLKQIHIHRNTAIYTDNKALMYACKKGRSNTHDTNRLCRTLLSLRLKGHIIAVYWIPTDKNPADEPSRMKLDF